MATLASPARLASPAQLALLAAVCSLMIGGCAGTGNGKLAFLSGKQTNESAESSVLDAGQTADMQFALGRMAEQQKQWPRAMTIYRQMLDADPKHPEATHRLAILYDRQGQFEQSSQWFQKALKLKPGDPELFCDIGYSLSSQGRYPEAEISLRQAIAVAPDHRRSHNHLGLVLAQRGQSEEALAAFRRADCSAAEAHANLALVLALNNQISDARQHLRYAQGQNGQTRDPAVQDRLEGLEALIAGRDPQPSLVPALADFQLIESPGQLGDERKYDR